MRRDKKEVRSGQEAGFSAEPTRIDMQSSTRNLDETARQTSAGRRIVGALASGLGRRSSSHYSPTHSPNSPSLLARRQFAFPILALLAVAALGLWLLLPGGALRAQESGAIEYAENRTDPVATYTAVDPEGAAIRWGLSGADASLFSIEGGVLTFKQAPDFESKKDIAGTETDTPTATAEDNIYEVVVEATDETAHMRGKHVMVEVTNVEEPGKVTLSALQPQSATLFTASLTDPDGSITGTTWQWAKADSKNGSYTDIDKASSIGYTPKDADINSYLRATASYTDGEGSDKSAMVVSDYAVQAIRGANTAPAFPANDPDTENIDENKAAAREVAENTKAGMAIGDPVVAEDKDGDVLTYTIDAVGAMTFAIDRATGQLKTKGPLNFDGGTETYTVTVRATDPAGVPMAPGNAISTDLDITAYSADILVTITVTDVNEGPAFTDGDAEVTFLEVDGVITTLGTYMATDPEDNVPITWSVSGADAGKFTAEGGMLAFKAKPDFEKPGDADTDNVYEVTVVAADNLGNRGTMDVKVTVTNEDEDGVVTLSRTQPRVGVPVTASLTDPDGSISGLRWQWYRGNVTANECDADGDDDCLIKGARSDTHTPTDGDVGKTLNAVASYTDGEDAMKSRMGVAVNVVAVDTRNRQPEFVDQDTETDGIQNETATREVEENTKALAGDDAAAAADVVTDNVGSAVIAEDPDPNMEPLIYTLSDPDAASFRVSQDNAATTTVDEGGQIEVAAGTELDFETKQTYMVTLMAEDSFGASASIMVTITVTDMDEVPDVSGDATKEYAENGIGQVARYTAVDPEQTAIVSWSLAGADASRFSIEGGALTFKKAPDYEKPGDVMGTSPSTAAPTDNMYEVTVQATDSTSKMGTKNVMVEVTNVEEPGKVTLSALQPQSATLFTASLTDPDNIRTDNATGEIVTGITWQWAKAGSRNGSYGDIDKANSSWLHAG